MDLASSLSDHSQKTNATVADFLHQQVLQAQKIDAHVATSVETVTDFSLRGGKSIRSFLTYLGYMIAQGQPHEGLLKACASVELHHKHILILDDIADRDETRYGGPTVEYVYKERMKQYPNSEHTARSFAMMDGVLLGTLSKELLLESGFPSDVLLACIHVFDTIMYRDTLAGWQIHGMQCLEPISNTTPEEFIKGLQLVTASYTFEGPLRVGLLLAQNKNETLEQTLTIYAQKVGTAFQVQDDILGLFGDPAISGKAVGNDVREGKKTLLIQTAYAKATEEDKQFLDQIVGSAITPEDLARVQAIVTTTGSLDESKRIASQMVEEGIKALGVLEDTKEKQLLIELAHYIITRDK